MPRKVTLRRFHRGELLLLTAKLHDRKLPIWIAQRYRLIALVRRKQSVFASAQQLGCAKDTAYRTVQEFNRFGFRRFERTSNPTGRPSRITRTHLRALIRVAQKRPTDVGLPFTHWSMTILQAYLVKRLRFPKVSPEWLRRLLHREGVSWQHTKTWKQSHDPDFECKKSVFWPCMPSVPSTGPSSVTINSARWSSVPSPECAGPREANRSGIGRPTRVRRASNNCMAFTMFMPTAWLGEFGSARQLKTFLRALRDCGSVIRGKFASTW